MLIDTEKLLQAFPPGAMRINGFDVGAVVRELIAAEPDARRYRQLRDESVADGSVYVWDERGEKYQECGRYISGAELDAVIDAALKRAEGGVDA